MDLSLIGPDVLGVLESTLPVVREAQHVRIDDAALERFAAGQRPEAPAMPREERLHCTWLPPRRFLDYLLALEALNFCFWDAEPRWRVGYGEGHHDGYWALVAALQRALREDAVPLWDAHWLAELDAGRLAHLLRGEGRPPPLLPERVKHLREVGEVLLARWGGEFANLVESVQGDAIALVQKIVEQFPSFRDEVQWRGRTVRFWKRAQICVADLARLLPDEGPRAHPLGRLHGRDRLTAFADYKVPQVLRGLGILAYDRALVERVDAGQELAAGSEEEVEIRAATIWACELLARRLGVTAPQVDMRLWIAGQRSSHATTRLPLYHRTRTVFY